MALAIVYSRASSGIEAPLVTVEVHISGGLPRFSIVGLPEAAVKESKDRVRSALMNSHFDYPARRITVNLAPADFPKEGGRFDLPIAVGILAATGQIPQESLTQYEFTGELALSGELHPIHGALPFALGTRKNARTLILPQENAEEACLVDKLSLLPAKHLLEVCAHLLGTQLLQPSRFIPPPPLPTITVDLAEVKGQFQAKRALEIAAAGQHSMLMMGPPGSGKSMLASRLPTILPDMSEEAALEAAAVSSVAGKRLIYQQWRKPSFRAPHHTASSVALVGGGNPPKPGEISLAHNGVLFLDELPEYSRVVLEALREPLESGSVTISRASHQANFPARFQLIGAMNPCPCGYLGDKTAERCQCTSEQVQRYQARISGPILDRIDMHIHIPALPQNMLTGPCDQPLETSAVVRERVNAARAIQLKRNGKTNSALMGKEIDTVCAINKADQHLLSQAFEQYGLSARAYHRVLKVARTIADLTESIDIQTEHLTEALSYRQVHKKR